MFDITTTVRVSSAAGSGARMIGAILSTQTSLKQSKTWAKKDVPRDSIFDWNHNRNHRDLSLEEMSPVTLLELFLTDDIVTAITNANTEYARQQGNNSFVLSNGDVRVFMVILFTSGYSSLRVRRLYWECCLFVHKEAIAKVMTRNRLEEILRFLHIGDNMHVDPTDKLSKIRLLITELNKEFLKYFPV